MYIAANSASHLGYLQVQGAKEEVGLHICMKLLDKCQHQHAIRPALRSSQAHGPVATGQQMTVHCVTLTVT